MKTQTDKVISIDLSDLDLQIANMSTNELQSVVEITLGRLKLLTHRLLSVESTLVYDSHVLSTDSTTDCCCSDESDVIQKAHREAARHLRLAIRQLKKIQEAQ